MILTLHHQMQKSNNRLLLLLNRELYVIIVGTETRERRKSIIWVTNYSRHDATTAPNWVELGTNLTELLRSYYWNKSSGPGVRGLCQLSMKRQLDSQIGEHVLGSPGHKNYTTSSYGNFGAYSRVFWVNDFKIAQPWNPNDGNSPWII